MFKEVKVHAIFNERTGYGIHASRFFPELDKLIQEQTGGEGIVHISLLDTVTASHTEERHPEPSILYNVWESDQQPDEFIKHLQLYDQLWVASEWQRAASIAQGIPEEFVKVVPEGVDPDVYKPGDTVQQLNTFDFLHVGQWQPRKSTLEICQSFLKAFPDNQDVRLYLSADTLFPSDEYKSTEERLVSYGVSDPRIIPIHYEAREDYIRRLQGAHVFVACARSEGWNLPLIEAMACGVVSIASDFGGSTEYAGDILNVRIRELKKPEGIYGGWDVPGHWGEPDYDHLVEVMRDAYENYTVHKEKALITSEMIRTKFSWDAAAQKAYSILEELHSCLVPSEVKKSPAIDGEQDLRLYARKMGYEITAMHKRRAIFTVDTHPDSQDKLETLVETIKQIKGFGYPVLVASHYPLPAPVVEMVDFYIFDKRDILSGEDKPIYWRTDGQGKQETVRSGIPCHALAALHNVRNAVDFCIGKYDWIYQMNSDVEVDLGDWLDKVHASGKDFICQLFEGQEKTVSGLITAGRTELMDKILLRIPTWEEFAKIYGDERFNSEKGYYRLVEEHIGLDNVEWLNMDVGNRFNQVDKNAWKDDMFSCHFVEGPFLHINGMSDREYDVSFTVPDDGNVYNLKQKVGMWSRPLYKFYKPWTVTATLNGEVKFQHTLDLTGKRVMVCLGSKALGDTIAWMPYLDEFRKKHNCHLLCSGWWQEIFDYPEIEFIKPGSSVADIYASYDVGCFDDQLDKNPINWRSVPLQKVATDILGLEYVPRLAKLKYEKRKRGNGHPPEPYVCFSEYSTMRNKLWNRKDAWQNVINHLVELGYECVSVSAEKTQLTGAISHNSQSIQNTIADIAGADFYIGLNAGPSWIALALGVPCIFITGVSEEWNDYPNPYRIAINHEVCGIGCFNDPSIPIDRGFEWCPRNKNYACTAQITEQMVFDQIDIIRNNQEGHKPHASKKQSAKTSDGNRRTSSQKTLQQEPESTWDEQRQIA